MVDHVGAVARKAHRTRAIAFVAGAGLVAMVAILWIGAIAVGWDGASSDTAVGEGQTVAVAGLGTLRCPVGWSGRAVSYVAFPSWTGIGEAAGMGRAQYVNFQSRGGGDFITVISYYSPVVWEARRIAARRATSGQVTSLNGNSVELFALQTQSSNTAVVYGRTGVGQRIEIRAGRAATPARAGVSQIAALLATFGLKLGR
jgi:hypothetical protein